MSHESIAILGIVLLLVLMFLRMPIAVCMILAGFIGICLVRGVPAGLVNLSRTAYNNATSYQLSMIPLFIFMGELAFRGGLSQDAFLTLYRWVGHLKGGLAMATVGACAAFGAVCGSHVATAATMCSAALPEMRRYKYNDTLSLGSICGGGNLGIMIPPSSAFVIYGFATTVPVGPLFIAGIVPGILITVLFCFQIYIQCALKPELGPSGPRYSWTEKFIALQGIWRILVVFILVIGGIYTGIFTPTESAAVGVFLVFILSIMKRQLTWNAFFDSIMGTVKISAMILLLVIGSMVFGTFLTSTETTVALANLIGQLEVNPYIILIAVMIFYIITGFFLDIYAVLLITLPILYPIVVLALGFDPLVFGVLSVLTVMIGSITPPVGVVVFAVAGRVKEVPIYEIFRGCMPFVVTMCVGLVLLIIFPGLSTLLPHSMLPLR